MSHKANRSYCLLLLLSCVFLVNALQVPAVSGGGEPVWRKEYGGKGDDILHASILTSDNNILLVGESSSFTEGDTDVYVAKVNLDGKLLWNITFSDPILTEDDAAYSVIEVKGGYIITGKISTMGGIGDDVLLLKISTSGKRIWSNHFGGNAWDWGTDLIQVSDNSILVLGTSQDFWSDYYDVYLIKTDGMGREQWKRKNAHNDYQYSSKIVPAENNEYLILGTNSNQYNNESDIFLMQVNSDGQERWFKQLERPGKETASDIVRVGENYIIAGEIMSGNTRKDIYIVMVDKNGDKIWERVIGTAFDDIANAISFDDDNIIITGSSFRNPGRNSDNYFIALTQNGDVFFNQTYGTDSYDRGVDTHKIGRNIFYTTGYTGGVKPNFVVSKLMLDSVILDVQTNVGETYGSGSYYIGSTPTFGVRDEIVYDSNNSRFVFTEWSSLQEEGYNGTKTPAVITIKDEVSETAQWKQQYYVDILQEGEGSVSPSSGWYDEGSVLRVMANPYWGYEFGRWIGNGTGSYSGDNDRGFIYVQGPITDTVVFDEIPKWYLSVDSNYGAITGEGVYLENQSISIGLDKTTIYLSDSERVVFREWVNTLSGESFGASPHLFISIREDTTLEAKWDKQYFVNITSENENCRQL